MATPRIHTVFFDVGDTLLSDYPDLPERISIAFKAIGLKVSGARLNRGLRRAEDYILPLYVAGIDTDHPAIRRKGLDILCESAGVATLDDDGWSAFYGVLSGIEFERIVHPGAPGLLEELKRRGIALGIISDWDKGLQKLLFDLGVGRYFDTFSVSAIVRAEKPSPKIFRDALTQMHAKPAECLHVGDFYEIDYLGARGVGMQALLYDWRGRSSVPCANRVESFNELAAGVLSIAGKR